MRPVLRAAMAGVTGCSILLGGFSLGQAQAGADQPSGVARRGALQHYNPNEGLQPNGCVKLCPLDTNPCDPPEFKRADGRCNLRD